MGNRRDVQTRKLTKTHIVSLVKHAQPLFHHFAPLQSFGGVPFQGGSRQSLDGSGRGWLVAPNNGTVGAWHRRVSASRMDRTAGRKDRGKHTALGSESVANGRVCSEGAMPGRSQQSAIGDDNMKHGGRKERDL